MNIVSLPKPGHSGASDIYLHLQTKRAGKAKGEAVASGHEGDICVRSWNWGAMASSAIGATQATARRSYKCLTLVKGFDTASTALLSALATNDEIKEAKLTVRKAGSEQIDYFTITLHGARVASVDQATSEEGLDIETVTLLFTKVTEEYRPQTSTGAKGGAFVFQDEVLPAA